MAGSHSSFSQKTRIIYGWQGPLYVFAALAILENIEPGTGALSRPLCICQFPSLYLLA